MKSERKGRLYGLVQSNAVLVLGFSLIESIENNLPIGFKDLGFIQWSIDGDFDQPEVKRVQYFLNETINLMFIHINFRHLTQLN